jgi:hypothetical protein
MNDGHTKERMNLENWLGFRVEVAKSATPQHVAQLLMSPMTVESQAVIDGIVTATYGVPIKDPAFEFYDHLCSSMYGASNEMEHVEECHVLVASILLECKCLGPIRFIFGVSDPLGLLLFASARHPHILPKHHIGEALESLRGVCVDPGSAAVLDAGVRVARALLPVGAKKPKLSEAALVAADCRATIDTDCETAGRAFWDWLSRTSSSEHG